MVSFLSLLDQLLRRFHREQSTRRQVSDLPKGLKLGPVVPETDLPRDLPHAVELSRAGAFMAGEVAGTGAGAPADVAATAATATSSPINNLAAYQKFIRRVA
jgi:hypothetical protein